MIIYTLKNDVLSSSIRFFLGYKLTIDELHLFIKLYDSFIRFKFQRVKYFDQNTLLFVIKRILRKSPNCGIASKIRISATPTNVYDRTYIVLHVYNSNFEQPIGFLVIITIKRRLAV